jgi:hypothetical protein
MPEIPPCFVDQPVEAPRDLAGLRNELHALYTELAQAIALAGPACQLSGRCCRFAEFGHTLFLTSAEALLLMAEAPDPVRSLDAGSTCPWQDDQGRCTARDARPLGCRVYYCDPSYEPEVGPALTERFLARLKLLTERHGLPWNYAPLHDHLRAAAETGQIAFPARSTGPSRAL